ncbi:maleylacetoacetate isomerase [Chenggangzhangella methanolivorans]|uniref:Maleylacetoacetate isomerase n=1 Tax=Chenggangzhangella methanolivorans TaxID=1437009 RepID=A0A9E6UIW8_9HYPH|nr:maleylacetoacetate isomerase [Chenggangzhangella methanolivorans]QZO01323.1 maleylacetoacetate isomerase [Chenggangzhangella methanolivorans]
MSTQDRPLTLFAYWRTSATYRVRVALALKGLKADEKIVDIDAGEHRSPEFLRINPLGAIPAMIDGEGDPLTQSLAILEYIEETHPEPPLLPADARGRARARAIAAMAAVDTHPLITPRVRRYLTGAGFDAAAWKAWQTHWFTTGLQAIEARLSAETATGAFCHGDQVTIADICLASIPAVMQVFDVKVADTPTVDRIVAALNEMPEFANADPYRQVGAPTR